MLNKILVLIGDVIQAQNAVTQATAIAKSLSCNVTLLGMVQPATSQFADPVMWNKARNDKRAIINALVAQFEAEHIPTQLTMLDTFLFEKFMRYLDENEFDLIVISDEDQITRTLMRDVLAYTTIPVFVARNRSVNSTRRVLVPLDGSRRAECILPIATLLAQSMNATLLLTHIVKSTEPGEQKEQEAARYLGDLHDRLPIPTEIINVTHTSISKGLHEVIRREQVDLVTLSAHGASGKPGQFFGRIAGELIDFSPTSLLILQDLPLQMPNTLEIKTGRYAGVR